MIVISDKDFNPQDLKSSDASDAREKWKTCKSIKVLQHTTNHVMLVQGQLNHTWYVIQNGKHRGIIITIKKAEFRQHLQWKLSLLAKLLFQFRPNSAQKKFKSHKNNIRSILSHSRVQKLAQEDHLEDNS